MAWRFIEQPNGKLARFSEVVDDFTHYDLTDAEAYKLARDNSCGPEISKAKVRSARHSPARFAEAIQIIGRVHGQETADERSHLLTDNPPPITSPDQTNPERPAAHRPPS